MLSWVEHGKGFANSRTAPPLNLITYGMFRKQNKPAVNFKSFNLCSKKNIFFFGEWTRFQGKQL